MKFSPSARWLALGLSLAVVGGCKREGDAGADTSAMDKGARVTKLGKTLGELTKEDLVDGLKRVGFENPTSSVSTSTGVTTTGAHARRGDLSVSLVLSAWSDPKARARSKEAKRRDANVAVFEDGDFYLVVSAKERDAASGARSRALLAQLIDG